MFTRRELKVGLAVSGVLILLGVINAMDYDRTGETFIPFAWAMLAGIIGAVFSGFGLLMADDDE